MKPHQIRNSLLLFLTAIIWGTTFVAQSVAMDYIKPFTFIGIRFTIGGIVLLPVIAFLEQKKKKGIMAENSSKAGKKQLFIGGICCGILLMVASTLQQFGVTGTSVGKAAFITALYIVLVPLLGIFFKRKAGVQLWVSVVVALIGLYLLCMKENQFFFNGYDVVLLLCAFTFALHILCVDHFSPLVDSVKLSCIQFFVCGFLALIGMILTEQPSMAEIMAAYRPILYAGVISSGLAYTLQVVGQKDLNPVIASLIMSLESVVSAISGWLILNQRLSKREIWGCIVM
ncbi:MAG: DMT family transporter, partial [Lachnospiraceae bacterium]|nr:DMT family transporter [Lachnospiraceae bacterium]